MLFDDLFLQLLRCIDETRAECLRDCFLLIYQIVLVH